MKIKFENIKKLCVHVLIFLLILLPNISAITLAEKCETINAWTINNKEVASDPKFFAGVRLPLFKQYPHLVNKISYLALAELPTPVSQLNSFGDKLNHKNIYLKNDAKTYGDFGGNKVRKLEFLLADALVNKADVVITTGSAGSNHSTATIALCKDLGLSVVSCLSAQRNTSYLRRNLLLSYLYGGNLNHFDSQDARLQGMIDCAEQFRKAGRKPYYIAVGGSVPRGALGYVNAAFELAEQIKNNLIPEPDTIMMAGCSHGTAAGLSLGIALAGLKSQIIAVGTEPEPVEQIIAEYKHLIDGMLKLLELPLDRVVQYPTYVNFYIGEGYAALTPKTIDSIKLLQDTENLKLDGTYAGKALGAFVDYAQMPENKGKTLLFWNTFCTGDFEDTINGIDYKDLPKAFHAYFEMPLQPGDLGV